MLDKGEDDNGILIKEIKGDRKILIPNDSSIKQMIL